MVEVIKSGFYTTVQDMGRRGYHEYGVPYSGAMDHASAKLANALLANAENAAVLEITMTGPTLEFKEATQISITGADMSPKINGETVQLNHCLSIKKGDVLSFGKLNYGFRCYLAVSGGFQTEQVMESRSMYKDVTSEYFIKKGDQLPIVIQNKSVQKPNAGIKIDTTHFTSSILEVYKGPEFEKLTKQQKQQLSTQKFTVSKDNNRMAYQLVEPIVNILEPIITSLVQPGTVQLTPSGILIVLMRDGQTAGGYPRILQLSENAINLLSQKMTGVGFTLKLKG